MKNATLAAIAAAMLACAAPALAAGSLTTQDYIEIEQLYAAYNMAIDSGDAKAWAATFTPDGSFNRFTGKEALEGFINQWRDKMNGGGRRHFNSNLRIVPSAEGANGSVYLMLVDVNAKTFTTASYADTLVKTAEGWRFKTRVTKADAPPAAAAPAPAAPKP